MTRYLFDTSALVKRYLTETGSRWVRQTVAVSAGNQIFVAKITPVEVVSALVRSQRQKNISSRQFQAARMLARRHTSRDYTVVQLDTRVSDEAEDLLERYTLRGMDAIQLASAVIINQRLLAAGEPALIFVAADQRLLTAAQGEGFQTEDPNQYP